MRTKPKTKDPLQRLTQHRKLVGVPCPNAPACSTPDSLRLNTETHGVRCVACGGAWDAQAMAGHLSRLAEAEAAAKAAKAATDAAQAERERLEAVSAAFGAAIKPRAGETALEAQRARQAAHDRLRAQGIRLSPELAISDGSRVLSDAEVMARGNRAPVLTPEAQALRDRQDARLRAAGILPGGLVHGR